MVALRACMDDLVKSWGYDPVVQFRLDIDADGKIAGCYVLARTSPDEFAELTCRMITRRAQFKPARDSAGKPVRSFFVSAIRYMFASVPSGS